MTFKKSHSIVLFLFIVFNIGPRAVMAFQEPHTNRTFDTNFKDRYSGNKFDYEGRKIISNTPSDSGNYADYKNKKPPLKEEDNPGFSIHLGSLSWLFYLALFTAVVFLVYILLNEGGSGWFSSKGYRKIETSEDITSETIQSADINALIHRAETNEDYRLAIRYYYLLVLKTLTLKNHIKFEDDKTNAEYLNDLKSKPFGPAFEYTSYLYSYIWYGKFPLDVQQYTQAKDKFTTLLNQVK